MTEESTYRRDTNELIQGEKFSSDLDKATQLLWKDRPEQSVDILYFFGRSYFDAPKEGLYRLAVNLYQQGMVKKIIVPGTEGERLGEDIPRRAHSGKTLMQNRLIGMGIPDNDIVFSEKGFHTRQEGDAFLKYSKEHGLHRAIAIANPHQITRAMLGLVKTILDHKLPIDVYAVVPDPNKFDWQRRVKGSQGMVRKPVVEHIQDEIDRIPIYQNQGDLASFEELFRYLSQRGTEKSA